MLPKINVGDRIILLMNYNFGYDFRPKNSIIEITSITENYDKEYCLGFVHNYSPGHPNISSGKIPNWNLRYGYHYKLYRRKYINLPKD